MKPLLIFLLSFLYCLPITCQEDFVMFLNKGEEAQYTKANIINEAKKEILVSYFIFEDEHIGLIALDLLLIKKEENPDIEIKLLLDGSGHGIHKSILYYLESKGIKIKEFHPTPKVFVPFKNINPIKFFSSIFRLNFRMHDKLIIVDGKKLISGGRNIEKSYYGYSKKNFIDRELYFESKEMTSKVRHYFYQLWNSKHVSKINYFKRNKRGKKFRKNVSKLNNIRSYINHNKDSFRDKCKEIDSKIKRINFEKAHFLSSYIDSTNKFDPYFLSTNLFKLASKIKKSVIIQTPYLLPTKRLYELLNDFKDKNINVEIMTNSYCSTDIMSATAAYDNNKEDLDKLGVKLYEYLGPNYLHAKCAVIDDSLALVGSYNMDPRSAYLNTELVFILDDKRVAKELKRLINYDKQNSIRVQKDANGNLQGYYDCEKSRSEMLSYIIFKFLTKFSFFYDFF